MPRPRGIPKTGGRRKGTLNRRTREVHEAISTAKALGIMPMDVMLENMRTCYASGDLQGAHNAAVDVAPYIHPRLTAIHASVQQTTVHIAGEAYERLILEIDRLAAAEGAGEGEEGAARLNGGRTHRNSL